MAVVSGTRNTSVASNSVSASVASVASVAPVASVASVASDISVATGAYVFQVAVNVCRAFVFPGTQLLHKPLPFEGLLVTHMLHLRQ